MIVSIRPSYNELSSLNPASYEGAVMQMDHPKMMHFLEQGELKALETQMENKINGR